MLLLEQELDSEFPLLLLEEPEAHLHPQLQMKLLQFIINKAKNQSNANGLQCILSTHSPNISSKASPENIIILSEGRAFSLRNTETELAKEDYIFLEKFLDVTKANLFYARGVILVEGPSENILLPTIASLLGKPLESHGISIINIHNTSWKRFAKIFLRKGKDADETSWNPIKVVVLCDLDLWPDSAEKNAGNNYGFKRRKEKNKNYWEKDQDVNSHIKKLKDDGDITLERQNVSVNVSDKWTFEYCLSLFGLFEECYKALHGSDDGIEKIEGTNEEKSTYIQREVRKAKTDFAFNLSLILEDKYKDDSLKLRDKLPPYITSAIDKVT